MEIVPEYIANLGVVAVSLFLFVSAIFLILKIIQTVRQKAGAESGNGNGNGKQKCISSPLISQLAIGQATYLRLVEKVEDEVADIKQNIVLQTSILERVLDIQEKMNDCLWAIKGSGSGIGGPK